MDTAYSPTIYLNFPLIRFIFPFSFVPIIIIELLYAFLAKWSVIHLDSCSMLTPRMNQAYPDYESLQQIFGFQQSRQSIQPIQTSQSSVQAAPANQGPVEYPIITSIVNPPRVPRLDTPAYPRYLALALQISAPLIKAKGAAYFTYNLIEAQEYPRFFIPLLSLLLHFLLTAKERMLITKDGSRETITNIQD